MNNRDYISSVITQFSGRNNVVPIPVIYLEITDDYPSAALLNQMIYWSDRTNRKDGYFYKTYNEWFEELRLSEYQVRRATKKLKSLGFVDTALKKANGAPTLHYKVDTKEVSEWILKKLKNGNLTNSSIESEETQESLTEITTEITTENTTKEILSDSKESNVAFMNLCEGVVGYLNHKTNSSYRYKAEKTKRLIKARMNDGFTFDDFKQVIDYQSSIWMNNDMNKYLRPETLFGPKFEGYLQTAKRNQPQNNPYANVY